MALLLRRQKKAALTFNETDDNFQYLEDLALDKDFLWNIDLLLGQTLDTVLGFSDFKINSIEDISGAPTTSIKVNGLPYTLGDTIIKGSTFLLEVDVPSVINLNCTEI